jgi:hypothetical protein
MSLVVGIGLQILGDLGGTTGQVPSIGHVLDVGKFDGLGHEETDDRRQDGDDKSGQDLLEHDMLVSVDESDSDRVGLEVLSMGPRGG